ncbi:MAG TPA: BON domain-containing protein [Gemmataceae bacterium]|nr:BON domain-containing protein [Gemmataceae bacterium]
MTVRKLFPLAAAFGLWAGGSAWAEPKDMPKPMSPADNQKLADAVATKLKTSGVTKGAKVEISTQDGVVDLAGTVPTQEQHQEILRALMTVKGVKRIESGLKVAGAADAPMPAAVAPPMMPAPAPMMMPLKPAQATEPVGLPPGAGNEPVPLNAGVGVAPLDPAGPNLPPYAWPTYAPYNNYSRVAYPGSYPYQAFPYIGPFYPFPKVPLGWRKVVLEWDDGHWYMGRITTPHDYWRVRFW